MKDFRDRVVVVTGGGGGIGRALGARFARAGARIVLADAHLILPVAIGGIVEQNGDGPFGIRARRRPVLRC